MKNIEICDGVTRKDIRKCMTIKEKLMIEILTIKNMKLLVLLLNLDIYDLEETDKFFDENYNKVVNYYNDYIDILSKIAKRNWNKGNMDNYEKVTKAIDVYINIQEDLEDFNPIKVEESI